MKRGASQPHYLRIAATIRGAIQSGEFVDRLPKESELAERLLVSRLTLRRAIAILADEGLVEVKHGIGAYVRSGAPTIRTIALVVAPDLAKHHTDLFHQRMLTSFVYACANKGWLLRVCPHVDDLHSRLRGPHGAAISGCVALAFGEELHPALRQITIPVVNVDGDPLANGRSVLADNAGGVASAIGHLVQLGHRHIAHISGGTQKTAARERRDAYIAAMRDAGLAIPDGFIHEGRFLREDGYAAMRQWWLGPVRPTAVFCANDLMALGAARWAFDHGLRVGYDVSIVGCDGLAVAYMVWPTITTLSLDFAAHASNAMDCLDERIPVPCIRRTPLVLTPRESSNRPPG